MNGNTAATHVALAALILLGGCAANISGTVRVVGPANQPATPAKIEGIIVNMINTSGAIENASHSVKTDAKGQFRADASQLRPGTYKIEANEPGFLPVSKTIEFKNSSRELELELRPIPNRSSRTYRSTRSDRDKIINPGEVNIQPPSM